MHKHCACEKWTNTVRARRAQTLCVRDMHNSTDHFLPNNYRTLRRPRQQGATAKAQRDVEKLTADRKAFIATREQDEIDFARKRREQQRAEQEAAGGGFDTNPVSFTGGRSSGGRGGGGGNFGGGGGGGNSGRRDNVDGGDSSNFDSNRNRGDGDRGGDRGDHGRGRGGGNSGGNFGGDFAGGGRGGGGGGSSSDTKVFVRYVRVCVRACARARVCVRVCVREGRWLRRSYSRCRLCRLPAVRFHPPPPPTPPTLPASSLLVVLIRRRRSSSSSSVVVVVGGGGVFLRAACTHVCRRRGAPRARARRSRSRGAQPRRLRLQRSMLRRARSRPRGASRWHGRVRAGVSSNCCNLLGWIGLGRVGWLMDGWMHVSIDGLRSIHPGTAGGGPCLHLCTYPLPLTTGRHL